MTVTGVTGCIYRTAVAVLWLGGPATLLGTCASLRPLVAPVEAPPLGLHRECHWGHWGVHPGGSPPRFGVCALMRMVRSQLFFLPKNARRNIFLHRPACLSLCTVARDCWRC